MEQLLSRSIAQPRFRTTILMAFSILALVMASIGIYGVVNYLVIQRTREFGIRLSLGATRADVLRLVLGRAILLVRFIAKLLFQTRPLDGSTFAVAPMVLVGVALLASYLPARRATR